MRVRKLVKQVSKLMIYALGISIAGIRFVNQVLIAVQYIAFDGPACRN